MSSGNNCRAIDRPAGAPACSLHEACTTVGLDRDGTRCPDCLLRDLCDSERRWLVKFRLARRQWH
jgi:hypothetical protein